MADLPGHSVAITSMCTTRLECFDKFGTRGKRNFETEILEIVFRRKDYLLTVGRRIFRETT